MIDDLFQAGTDAVGLDMVRRAKPAPVPETGGVNFWNLVRAGPRSFGAGVSRYIAGQADIVGAFGQVLGAYPEAIGVDPSPEQADQAAAQRTKLLKDGIDFSDPAGDVFRARAADLMPDPITAHWSEQVVGGFGSLFGTLGGSILGAGPLAPVAFGMSEGLGEADKLKAKGVDLATRTKAGAVYGTVQGATIVAPVIGRGALETVGLVAAAGPGAFMASNAAEQTILRHAGYDKIAGQYDPFDPWGLAAATLFPGTIAGGAHALRVIRAPAKPIAAPKNEADMRTAVALNPAEQAASDAFERSAGNLRELDAAIAKEKNAGNRAILVAERQRLSDEPAAAAVAADPELVDAARVRHQSAVADSSRLSADGDLAGMNAHTDALAKATDQLSNGEPVNVADLVAEHVDTFRAREAIARIGGDDGPRIVNPIDLSSTRAEKIRQLAALTEENKPVVKGFLSSLDEQLGTRSSDNVKTDDSILGKAQRPSILAAKPWHDIEHIRDSYRFKTVLDNIEQLPQALERLQALGATLIKADVGKVLEPGGFGWRIAAFDLRMKNGQLVEYYLPLKELEAAKKGEGHRIFESVRNLDQMNPANHAVIEAAKARSREVYQAAFDAYLRRTGQDETAVRASLTRATASAGGSSVNPLVRSPTVVGGAGEVQAPSLLRIAENPPSTTKATGLDSETKARVDTASSSTPSIPLRDTGNAAVALTERGTEIPVRWAVVEAADLVTSHGDDLARNPGFPADLQPRDRGRAASEQQIASIENAIKPQLLGESPKASDGAPIIGKDGVVESGNARTIALRRAYASGKADHYKAWLEANVEKVGLDPKVVAGMDRPVLVRVGEGDYNRAEFARQANESAVAGMSSTEQAKADAARMPDLQALVANDDGTINVAQSGTFVRAFMQQVVAPAERGGMMTAGGELSQQGLTRIRNAVFSRAYGDADLVAMMAESTDANVKNVLAGMLRAAPRVAQLADLQAAGARPAADITGPLVEAVRKFSQLRADGMTVDNFLAQRGMFDDGLKPETEQILKSLQADARAPKRVAETITSLVDSVDSLGDPRQAGMFDAPDGAATVKLSAEQAAMQSRVDAMLAADPNMPVRLPDGEETTLAAALEAVRKEFAGDTGDANLATVAAECFLRAA